MRDMDIAAAVIIAMAVGWVVLAATWREEDR